MATGIGRHHHVHAEEFDQIDYARRRVGRVIPGGFATRSGPAWAGVGPPRDENGPSRTDAPCAGFEWCAQPGCGFNSALS